MPKRDNRKLPKPHKMSVLLTDDENKIIETAAGLLDSKKATALKVLAFQDSEKLSSLENTITELKKIAPLILSFNNELSRIGNNLNQIAYALNSGQHPIELHYCIQQVHTFLAMSEAKLMPILRLEVMK